MSSAIVVGSLFANLGLNTADFQAGLDLADRDAKKFAKDTQAGMKGMASGIAASAGQARAALTGMVSGMGAAIAGIGLAGLATAVQESTRAVASLNDEAKQAGLSLKAFQEWKFVAEQNRIGLDAMVDGFKELSLRADEFAVTGKGSAAEAFQRLGLSADDLRGRLQEPSDLFLELIDRVEKLDKAAQIRIFDELLGGTGGEQFVRLIEEGSGGLRQQIDLAHRLGRVLTSEVVESAVQIDKEFQQIRGTMEQWLQAELVQFARDLRRAYLDIKSVYDIVLAARDGLRDEGDRKSETLQSRINDIFRERLALLERIKEERVAAAQNSDTAISLGFNQGAENAIATLQAKIDELNAEEDRLIKVLTGRADGQAGAGSNLPPKPVAVPLPPERPFADIERDNEAIAQRAAREKEAMQQRLDHLRQALMTEEEAERFSFETRMNDLRTYLDNRLITEAEYDELSLKAREEMSTRLTEIAAEQEQRQSAILVQSWQYTADAMGSLAQLAEQFGQEGFIAAKALGIGQAVVNVAVGITEALKQPFPLNFAVAASVAAAGAAQIATIASAQPGNARRPSFNGGVGATVGSGPAVQKPGETATPTPVYLNVSGDLQPTMEELFRKLNEGIKDGYRIIIPS